MSRKPIRWRIAEVFEGPNGATAILAIGAAALAVFIVPLVLRPFEGRPADPEINQTEIRCEASYSEIQKGIPDGTTQNDPLRVCVEKARGKVLMASVVTFFIILFTVIALMARAGKIQPKEVAR
jgi:hypothetical protein